jgi:hypothetical protein
MAQGRREKIAEIQAGTSISKPAGEQATPEEIRRYGTALTRNSRLNEEKYRTKGRREQVAANAMAKAQQRKERLGVQKQMQMMRRNGINPMMLFQGPSRAQALMQAQKYRTDAITEQGRLEAERRAERDAAGRRHAIAMQAGEHKHDADMLEKAEGLKQGKEAAPVGSAGGGPPMAETVDVPGKLASTPTEAVDHYIAQGLNMDEVRAKIPVDQVSDSQLRKIYEKGKPGWASQFAAGALLPRDYSPYYRAWEFFNPDAAKRYDWYEEQQGKGQRLPVPKAKGPPPKTAVSDNWMFSNKAKGRR